MKQQKTYTVEEATKKLEYYCAYQDRCHKEVNAKLKEMRMITVAIDHIVAHLIQHNFLNEERFAKSFARGKFRIKKWGKQRIIRELKSRDISSYNIKSALKEISDEEYLKAFEALSDKKWFELKDQRLDVKKKKLLNYLQYRGWEISLVYQKINDLSE